MRRRDSRTIDLREELNKALQAGRVEHALDLYRLIEKRKPTEPRWPHSRGDLLCRMGRQAEAVAAYERAIDLYVSQGFAARAMATAKVMLEIDPSKAPVLARLQAEAADGPRHPLLTARRTDFHHRR